MYLIVCIFLLSGCNFNKNNNTSKSEAPIPNNKMASPTQSENKTAGTTLGLFDETALTKINETFKISETNGFTPTISIENRDIKDNVFRLFFIIDYKQFMFLYNERNIDYLDISLKPNETKRFDVKLNNLSEGLHDLILFCIRRPDDLLTEQKFFPPGQFNVVKRATLLVGEKQENRPQKNYKSLQVNQSEKPIPLFVSEKPRNTMIGEVVTLIDNGKRDFWINFSTQPNTKYAMLIFAGNKMENVSFYQSERKGVANIPVQFKNGLNQNVFIALVDNPFIVNSNDSNVSWDIQTTNRISIK